MSTLIRIDRGSFRRNPDAGETVSTDVGNSWFERTTIETTVTGYQTTEVARSVGPVSIVGNTPVCDRWDVLYVNREQRLGGRNHVEVRYKPKRDVITQMHAPIEEWLFDYVPTDVTCCTCNATYPHTLLNEDAYPDEDGGDITVENICPKCDELGCCDIEYVDPESVAAELGL